LRRARRKVKKFGSDVGRDLKRSFKGVTRTLATLGGVGAGVGFAVIGREVLDFERKLTRLGIQAGRSSSEMARFRDRVRNVGRVTGAGADQVLEGARAFVSATGNFEGASQALETFAKVAVASGAEMADVTKTAAGLQKTLKIDPSDFEQAFGILLEAGKAGSVELRELSTVLGSTAPLFAKFGKEGTTGLKDLAAAFQVIAPEFGFSAQEAATGLRGLFVSLQKNRDRIKRELRVDVFQKGTKELKNFDQILREFASSDRARDSRRLFKALGRAEAVRTLNALTGSLGDAEGGFDALVKTGGGIATLNADFEAFNRSTAGRLQRSKEQIKDTFARILTPDRINKITAAFQALADVVGFLAENLTAVIGIVAGGKLITLGGQVAGAVGALRLGRAGAAAAGGAAAAKGAAGAGAAGAAGGGALFATAIVGAAALGVALGRLADQSGALSDRLAGVDQNIIRGTAADPTGAAARLRARAAAIRNIRAPGRTVSGIEIPGARIPLTKAQEAQARGLEREAAGVEAENRLGAVRRLRRSRADIAAQELAEQALGAAAGQAAGPQALSPERALVAARQFQEKAISENRRVSAAERKQIVEILIDPQGLLKLEDRQSKNILRAP
jgi:TP901 family phage tail tape measure protein